MNSEKLDTKSQEENILETLFDTFLGIRIL